MQRQRCKWKNNVAKMLIGNILTLLSTFTPSTPETNIDGDQI